MPAIIPIPALRDNYIWLVREGRIRSARDGASEVMLGLTDEEGFSMKGMIDFIDNKFPTVFSRV